MRHLIQNVTLFVQLLIAKELAENSHVQDAFVIAVEQQAKERLERLSALRRIKPVDMTKLSQQVLPLSFLKWKKSAMTNISKSACTITFRLKSAFQANSVAVPNS